MPTAPGQTISHYRLVEKIGEGGMGVVWKAEDTVLNRAVAIKLLPADAGRADANDEESRRRMFLEEAQLASSVSHAHIVQVYEFGREGDLDFIVMEFVEGQPLSKLMRGRPLPPHKVAEYGHQVALAVARAHSKGLIHRDLKPGNILLTTAGEVKVVDFGLAILFERRDATVDSRLTDLSEVDTKSIQLRTERRVAGTLPYMSPEQVRGDKLDGRSDVFSLGIVLYEMATGFRPFNGRTHSELAAEIQKARPTPVHDRVAQVPFDLDRAVEKCLAARPAERYQTMDDLAVDLKRLARDLESGSSPSYEDLSRSPARKPRWAIAAVVVVAVIALIAAALFLRPAEKRASAAPTVHRQVTFTGNSSDAELSPDGQFVAYLQSGRLMVQELAGGAPLEVLRENGVIRHRWSPTGAELLVLTYTADSEGWACYLVPRLGGTKRKLQALDGPISWSPDGEHYATGWTGFKPEIRVVGLQSGNYSEIPLGDGFKFLIDIDWSPTGDYYAIRTADSEDATAIWTMPTKGGARIRVSEEKTGIKAARWSGDGSSIYYLLSGEGTQDLRRIRIDQKTGKAASVGATLLTGLQMSSISLSRDGRKITYTKRISDSDLWLVTPNGQSRGPAVDTRQLTSGTFKDTSARVAPDGSQMVFVRSGDIYAAPIEGGPVRQITFNAGNKWSPAWSPDGKWVAFGSSEGGTNRVWKVASGGGTPKAFGKTEGGEGLAWAPGSRIAYMRTGNRNIHLLDPDSEEETPLVKDESVGWIFSPEFSPDGTRVAVLWNRPKGDEHGDSGLWTISLPDSSERRVSSEGFTPLGWSADGA